MVPTSSSLGCMGGEDSRVSKIFSSSEQNLHPSSALPIDNFIKSSQHLRGSSQQQKIYVKLCKYNGELRMAMHGQDWLPFTAMYGLGQCLCTAVTKGLLVWFRCRQCSTYKITPSPMLTYWSGVEQAMAQVGAIGGFWRPAHTATPKKVSPWEERIYQTGSPATHGPWAHSPMRPLQ